MKDKTRHFFSDFALKTYGKNEILVRAGADPQGVFYLLSGRVAQYDISPAGNIVVVNVFKPGAFFPMSWAINKTPNYYFFEATIKSTVNIAPAEQAVEFVRDNPDILFDLLSRVYKGTDGVLRRMAHLMGGSAKSRLLFEIINATMRFGQTEATGQILLGLNESDLAKQSGLARETVNRVLHELKQDGLVTVSRQGLVIKNVSKLESALGEHL